MRPLEHIELWLIILLNSNDFSLVLSRPLIEAEGPFLKGFFTVHVHFFLAIKNDFFGLLLLLLLYRLFGVYNTLTSRLLARQSNKEWHTKVTVTLRLAKSVTKRDCPEFQMIVY